MQNRGTKLRGGEAQGAGEVGGGGGVVLASSYRTGKRQKRE